MLGTIARIAAGGLVLVGCAGPALAEKPASTTTVAPITGKDAIYQALKQKIDVDFAWIPLEDAATTLGQKLHVAIHLDVKALIDVGVAADEPVTFQQSSVSGAEALKAILRRWELTWVAEDEWLLITSSDVAETMVETVAYDVTDLLWRQDEKGQWVDEDFDSLVSAIENGADHSTWSMEGGPGTITPLALPTSSVLVVSQLHRVQERVAGMLAELRKVEESHGKATLPKPTPEQMLRRRWARMNVPPDAFGGIADDHLMSFQLPVLSDRDLLVRGANGFAWALYRRLASQPGNVFCSPASIVTALGMVQIGARHQTAAEFGQVLELMHQVDGQPKWEISEDRLPAAYASWLNGLHAREQDNGYELTVAHQLWARNGRLFEAAYLERLYRDFQAGVTSVDFTRPAEAAQTINAWVGRETHGSVQGNLQPGLINDATALAVSTAAHFRGLWIQPFRPANTQNAAFYTQGKTLSVPTMTQTLTAGYLEVDGLQVLELRFLGEAASMLLILPPREPGALAELEKTLSAESCDTWRKSFKYQPVEVHLPRFSFQTIYNLKETLHDLGLKAVFTAGEADLSGMDGKKELFLQFVLHQARVEVDEEGTQAAAFTGMPGDFGGDPKPAVFKADHPFLFLIHDPRSNAILFVGRVMEPIVDRRPAAKTIDSPPRRRMNRVEGGGFF